MPETFPQSFGRYELLEKLASGGMAEVFRARAFGIEGFQKPVAIKRILPHLSTQSDFIAMLTDEAKTVVRLTHANIVEVYDFGKVDDSYYVAMEFIDGIDLATLIKHCQGRRQSIPIAIAAWIVREACRGLAYAHGRRGEDGTPLGIVHRDISPANILVARTGEVKLTDFGIAKAATNIFATDTGVLKGKIAYMAPEQAGGAEPDPRSDLFSLGLVLIELLTLRRFFTAASQTELLRKVKEIQIAEADIPSTLPVGVRKIVARLLAHDPARRYQAAHEVEEDLTIFLSGAAPNLTTAKIVDCIRPFLPHEPLWKPLATLTHLVPEPYRPVATAVAEKTTRMKRPIGWLLVASGLIGDVLKPVLVSFAPLLCAVSAVASAATGIAAWRKGRRASLTQLFDSRLGATWLFCAASFVIWGTIALLQYATPARGVIAATLPPVATVQDTLAKILGKLTVIETTTTEIAKDVKDIKEAIAALANSDSLVKSPSTPQEFYHNARVYQLRGMNDQALAAYKRFCELAPDFVDAHLMIQLLTRDTPGASNLEGWYDTLAARHPTSAVVPAMRAKWNPDRAARVAAFETLRKGHADFPPLTLLAAREYFDQGWVGKTRYYLQRLNALFTDVAQAVERGELQPFFIDKEAMERELESMRAWKRYVQSMTTEWSKPALQISVYEGDQFTSLSFIPQENGVRKILYSIDDPEPKLETGIIPGQMDPITNTPYPQTQITGTIPEGKHTIYARYIDRDGSPSEIFQHTFETRPFRVDTSSLRGAIGASNIDMRVYFMPKAGKTFAKYRYSVDAPTLDQASDQADLIIKTVPFGSHILYVKAIDAAGKETATFEIPFATE